MRSRLALIVVLLSGFLLPDGFLPSGRVRGAPPAQFDVTEIPAPSGALGMTPAAINVRSTAVGYTTMIDSGSGVARFYPVRFRNGVPEVIGGDGIPGGATDINRRGRIVGYVEPELGDSRPALLVTDGFTEIGTLGGGGRANAINAGNQVVGFSAIDPAGGEAHAFLWEDGDMSDLGTLVPGGASMALDINDDGLIVGTATFGRSAALFAPLTHAVLWDNGNIVDLGALGNGDLSVAFGINNNGQIVGVSTTSRGETYGSRGMRAFLWQNGAMEALGRPDGSTACVANAINNNGWIVGLCDRPGGSGVMFVDSVAVLWVDGEPVILDDLVSQEARWSGMRALAVNDNGQIVCTALDAAGDIHALILTPAAT
jgi:probable HAF family extracellular repeat protein